MFVHPNNNITQCQTKHIGDICSADRQVSCHPPCHLATYAYLYAGGAFKQQIEEPQMKGCLSHLNFILKFIYVHCNASCCGKWQQH